MINYQQKYLKYKTEYINFNNMLGGTQEENNNYLLHGTNLFYIDDIKINGLNGIYNQKIYDMIKKYWPTISHLSRDNYVSDFIKRQEVRESGVIQISFTGLHRVAKEYSEGARKFGEGPSRFLTTFDKYIKEECKIKSPEIMEDYNFIYNASIHPGIILAIDKNDFLVTKNYTIDDLNMWEIVLYSSIPADKLYIRIEEKKYILLLSDEGHEYIDNLKSAFLEEQKLKKDEEKKIEDEINKGNITTFSTGPYFQYKIIKKDYNILAIYDTYGENSQTNPLYAEHGIISAEIIPHYLQLRIYIEKKININIIIRVITGTTDYKMIEDSKDGFDLFMANDELKHEFTLATDYIKKYIPQDRKEKMFRLVNELFSYLPE